MTRWQRFRWALRRKPRTREQALANIRLHYREMGIPIDDLSDEEVERRILAWGKLAATSGVTVAEASAGLQRLSKALSTSLPSSR